MVETSLTSGFVAASEDKDGSAEDDPGPSSLNLLIEHDGWRAIDGAEAAVRRAYEATVAILSDEIAGRDVSILLSSDEAIAALNARYRGKNKPTNVLSFPAAPDLPAGGGPLADELPPLGDIIIALETVLREATDEEKPLLFHLSHLTVHGLLHLAGFDHETDSEAERMETLERHILASIGIPDPYASITEEKPAQSGQWQSNGDHQQF
jgi:probable rRNA maturation factor